MKLEGFRPFRIVALKGTGEPTMPTAVVIEGGLQFFKTFGRGELASRNINVPFDIKHPMMHHFMQKITWETGAALPRDTQRFTFSRPILKD